MVRYVFAKHTNAGMRINGSAAKAYFFYPQIVRTNEKLCELIWKVGLWALEGRKVTFKIPQ